MPGAIHPHHRNAFGSRVKSIRRVEGPVAVSSTSPCALSFSSLRLTSGTVFPLYFRCGFHRFPRA
jgi:hypothetical protein